MVVLVWTGVVCYDFIRGSERATRGSAQEAVF